ncbi:MAG: hypothetical protein Q9221_002642 [Calogaya cf. arnoldii]
MQYSTILLIATLVGATITAPTEKKAQDAAVINTRFLKYENKPRDAAAEEKKAVINTRFLTYENKPRDATPEQKDAVINTRFLTYENKHQNKARDAAPEADASTDSRSVASEVE